MKNFVIKTLLLMLPIAILAISAEILLRQIPNAYSYKNSYWNKHSEKIQVAIWGSSQTYLGVDPVYFSQNTFNAAHVSQSFDLDFYIFNKYIKRADELKVIIMPISYFSLWFQLSDSDEHWRMKNYALYYGLKVARISDYSELLSEMPEVHIRKLKKYLRRGEDVIGCTPLGWGTQYKNDPENKNLEISGKTRATNHTYDIHSEKRVKAFETNVKILESFVQICSVNNIQLLFLTPPTHDTYRKNLNNEQLNKMFETVNNLAQKHRNVLYVNWHDAPEFVADDFYDSDHLNGSGAKKLSIKLAGYIDSLGIFGGTD